MINPKSRIQNQKSPVVLITGASQGIGAVIARTFARELRGVRLALVARNMKNLLGVARACTKWGARAEAFECDVGNESSVALMADAVTARFGAVDVLINNAGAFAMAPFVETKVDEFDRMIAVNLRSAFLVTRAFLPAMLQRKGGDIFFMSSIAGLGAYPDSTAYCAAKFGVTGMAKVLRAETREHGIRVCCVHPGATWSPSWEKSGVKPERIMPADDIARAILDVYRLDRRTVVEEIVLRPQLGDV
jgi:NAD(P)-dependent dehydrogenase (short-subunit alcohol dehydrogenase family)